MGHEEDTPPMTPEERLQFGEDMLDIYELRDKADQKIVMRDDEGNITQSGTVRDALIDCKFFHHLEPHVVREIISESLSDQ
jgi:hypothetical protein